MAFDVNHGQKKPLIN